jgi:hypothetical protein
LKVTFSPPRYAQLWKKDVKNTKMQAGCALLDFCTEYSAMLITFPGWYRNKMLFFTALMYSGCQLPVSGYRDLEIRDC